MRKEIDFSLYRAVEVFGREKASLFESQKDNNLSANEIIFAQEDFAVHKIFTWCH